MTDNRDSANERRKRSGPVLGVLRVIYHKRPSSVTIFGCCPRPMPRPPTSIAARRAAQLWAQPTEEPICRFVTTNDDGPRWAPCPDCERMDCVCDGGKP